MIITFDCDEIEIGGYLEELAELGWQVIFSHPDGDYVYCEANTETKRLDIEYYEEEDECPCGDMDLYSFLESVGIDCP